MKSKSYIYYPLAFALVLVAGIWLGKLIGRNTAGFAYSKNTGGHYFRASSGEKINAIMDYVEEEYVDTVNKQKLTDKTIADMLQELDPHSAYMTADERKRMNEPLEGNFEGIGIEFNIVNDSIRVMNVINGGPSEKAGIHSGDRIALVDGKPFTGKKLENKDVLHTLRGKGGTQVKITVKRPGVKKLVDFVITRGTIPIYSIDAAYMIDKKTGYIKLSRFASTSYDEYLQAYGKLKAKGMQKMILDLRGNGGGYLNIAVSLADEFLKDGEMIVYTKGRTANHRKRTYIATSKGGFEDNPLVLLIDEGSASASEIIAGAIQDNDRGTIVGRRSFGKGLVQEEKELADGSAFRLTIARYYTPSGRCIQRPYNKGTEEYYQEEYDRYKNGELLNADSIKFADTLKFKTLKGRTVYGGGGIMPDVFVPLDTAERSHFTNELIYRGIIRDFILDYSDKQGDGLRKKGFEDFHTHFKVDDALLNNLLAFAGKKDLKADPGQIQLRRNFLENYIKATIARVVWGEEQFYVIFNEMDKTLAKALNILGKQD